MRINALLDTLAAIETATGLSLDHESLKAVPGGDINQAFAVSAHDGQRFFLKVNDRRHADLFVSEQGGLGELDKFDKLRVPASLASGQSDQHAWLLLEWLNLAQPNAKAARHLGRALADQHQTRAKAFGLDTDNHIGRTRQHNAWCDDWVAFYRDRRLQPQLELAVDNGLTRPLQAGIETIQQRLGDWFEGYSPVPSLLHGDLWGGNWAMLANGQPVVFDPAVYYGDRETDIAMTRLFGGFPDEFYAAYAAAWPLDHAAHRRQPLYDLYHVLNHFNLFGGSYLAQADRMVTRLLGSE